MTTKKFLPLLVFVVVFLAGCAATGPKRDVNDPTNSLVFGYIDMDDAPTDMSYATVKQVLPREEEGYWQMGVDDGLFFNQYLPNGGYQMSRFGGSGFFSGEHEYGFPEYGRNATAVRIGEPGIYFVGAYKYVEVDTGFFEQDKFDIAPIQSPGERELLERLAAMDWVKGTQWEARIRTRLAELGR